MLNTKDIAILRGMFRDHEIRFDQKLDDLKMNLRDEMHSLIKASEAGLIRRMDEGFSTVLETLDREMFPQLNRHEQEILALKLHVKIA